MHRTATILAAAGLSACGVGEPAGTLYVTSIEVTNAPSDKIFAEDLEVEVYIMERASTANTFDRAIACAGTRTGLDNVVRDDVTYNTDAYFIDIQDDVPDGEQIDRTKVRLDWLRGRDLYVVVVEDDDEACPRSPTYDDEQSTRISGNRDDLLGKSGAFDPARLEERPVSMAFGDVVRLELDIVRAEFD